MIGHLDEEIQTHKTKFHRDSFARVELRARPTHESKPGIPQRQPSSPRSTSIPQICLTNPSGTRGPEPTAREPAPGTSLQQPRLEEEDEDGGSM
jgi:hypothetical protein